MHLKGLDPRDVMHECTGILKTRATPILNLILFLQKLLLQSEFFIQGVKQLSERARSTSRRKSAA